MKIIHPADKPPNERALHEPIESDEDLDQVLRVLSWIQSRRDTVLRALQQVIELKRAEAHAKLTIDLDGTNYTFDEVEQAMLQQVADYGMSNRDRLFAKSRTFKLPHGSVLLRKKRDAINLAEGMSEREVLELLGDDERFVRTKREIDKQHILAQLSREQLTPADLVDRGLQYVRGSDEVRVGDG